MHRTPAARYARWLLLGAAACLLAVRTHAQDLQVIDLKYRLADEIIPIVRPLLEPGGALTGMDNVLFVRASPGNFAQISQVVSALDRPPRQLLVTVGQGTVANRDAADLHGSATIGDGDAQLGVNRPPAAGSAVQLEARAVQQQANLHDLSSVRVEEGSEAYIAIGRSAPVTATTVSSARGGSVVQQTTQYRDAASGFYATPHVHGDRVVLEISSRQQAIRGRDGAVETVGTTSTVSGRLGEWIPVGAVRQSAAGAERGLLAWGAYAAAAEYSAWVKVEEIR